MKLHPACCWPFRPEKVAEYVQLLEQGSQPPPIVFQGDALVDGRHRLAAWVAFGKPEDEHPAIQVEGDPWAYVYRQHAGVRIPTMSELADQIQAHVAATGIAEEAALKIASGGNPKFEKYARMELARRRQVATIPRPPRTPAGGREDVRVIIPDSHGEHIDLEARDAFLADLKSLNPKEIVMLGDHLDCGGFLSTHQRSYTKELTESYTDDVKAANEFLDRIQALAPRAVIHYIEGNHEFHVERWATREIASTKDSVNLLDKFGPEAVLELKRRGIKYYRQAIQHMGLSVPGAIQLGKCFFTHGSCAAKHAAAAHVDQFAGNVVHGHVHRAQAYIKRTVSNDIVGGWCPGTLSKLQMLYNHNKLTDWSHGYGIQFVSKSGVFLHVNVPIVKGVSLLPRAMRTA